MWIHTFGFYDVSRVREWRRRVMELREHFQLQGVFAWKSSVIWNLNEFQTFCKICADRSNIVFTSQRKPVWNIINQVTCMICWSCNLFCTSYLHLWQGMLLCPGQPRTRIINVDSVLCSTRFIHEGFLLVRCAITDSAEGRIKVISNYECQINSHVQWKF